MNRIHELELLIHALISKVQISSVTYGITSSTFRSWLEDLNSSYKEYNALINSNENKE